MPRNSTPAQYPRGTNVNHTRLESVLALVLAFLPVASRVWADESWPEWRGPLGTGVAPNSNPPVTWDEQTNVHWKVRLPGKGHSTPVVVGGRIYLTTAVPVGPALPPRESTAPGTHDGEPVTHRHEFFVLAIDQAAGTLLWKTRVHEKLPHEGGHVTGSLASNSIATDGERLYACFGSHGLHCLDTQGRILWQRQFGEMQTKHGHGESTTPVVFEDWVYLNWDQDGPCFVTALDKRTGKTVWKVDRDEDTSWSSPILTTVDGQPQLIVAGTNRLRGYDPKTGNVIWECGGLSSNIVATPVAAEGMLFAGSSYEKRVFLALRLEGARGDITGSRHVAWNRMRGTPYVPSPLLYGSSLYYLTHYQGIMTRVEAATGVDQPGAFRVGALGNIYASPVGGGGRVYVTDLDGTTVVLSHEDSPRVLAVNRLDESFAASAAIVGSDLFLRGRHFLYCLRESSRSAKE